MNFCSWEVRIRPMIKLNKIKKERLFEKFMIVILNLFQDLISGIQ